MTVGIKNVTARTTQTVVAGLVRGLIDMARSMGASESALAERSGITHEELRHPDNRVASSKFMALMRAAKELCHDPAFALHFGESAEAEAGVGCVIGGFADTGADAFALINRYSRLTIDVECIEDGDRFALAYEAGDVWIVDRRRSPDEFPELTEFTFASMVAAARRALGENHYVKAVNVTHREPAHRADYDRVFRLPVVFGSDKNGLLLTADTWLRLKPPSSSRTVAAILSSHGETLLEQLRNSKTTRGRVEQVLITTLHSGNVRMAAVAATLGVSRQTLFRRLRDEGTRFEEVLDALRHKLAVQYLKERKASIDETAYALGYSDRAALSRAFKRWTGSSPQRFREGS